MREGRGVRHSVEGGEMVLRREGRQWLNTGLTIKAAESSVFFEVCSSAATVVTFCNPQVRVRQRGGGQRELEILCDSQTDMRLSKHYLLLGWSWSITCHSTILLFLTSSTVPSVVL